MVNWEELELKYPNLDELIDTAQKSIDTYFEIMHKLDECVVEGYHWDLEPNDRIVCLIKD